MIKYTQVQQLRKEAKRHSSWDPNYEDFNGTQFAWNTDKLHEELNTSLKKHYAGLLAKAYKDSTGETLKDPEKHIDPRFGYAIGRASNVRPEVLAKLNEFYRNRLAGWTTTSYNVTPGLAMDAVDMSNATSAMYPYNYSDSGLDPNAAYRAGQKIEAKLVNK